MLNLRINNFFHKQLTIACLAVSIVACGGSGGETTPSNNQPSVPTPTPTPSPTPAPTPTVEAITPTFAGNTAPLVIDLETVKPIILDTIYALDVANVLVFGDKKGHQLLRPENDFRFVNIDEDKACSSGSQTIDFREFEQKIVNREPVDIVGSSFDVTYSNCVIGNFTLSGTAQILVNGFDNTKFEITSFLLNIDDSLNLTIDDNNYLLKGNVNSSNNNNFVLDLLLTSENSLGDIYLSKLAVVDLSDEFTPSRRLSYQGNIYFEQGGEVTIASNPDQENYTFKGRDEHQVIFDHSKLRSRAEENIGFIELTLETSYYKYPELSLYLNQLRRDKFLTAASLDAIPEPNIFQFEYPFGTSIQVEPDFEDGQSTGGTLGLDDFYRQEWQFVAAPEGIDTSIKYGHSVRYDLSQYGHYTLRNTTFNSAGAQRQFEKTFSVAKPSNIDAHIEVVTVDWQLGHPIEAKVVTASSSEFTASFAFGPSGMTVTENGAINWDGKYIDFGEESRLTFGVYVETDSGRVLVKHTLLVESNAEKSQFKIVNNGVGSLLYPNTVKEHGKPLYETGDVYSYVDGIDASGFTRLDVTENSIDFNYIGPKGYGFGLTVFDVAYNQRTKVVDFLMLQNSMYSGEVAPDRLKIDTEIPWVLFNSNNLEQYVEVAGDENADRALTIINKISAKFTNPLSSESSGVIVTNTNVANTAKFVDQRFELQREVVNEKINKILYSCAYNENVQLHVSFNNYLQSDTAAIYDLREGNENLFNSNIVSLDRNNDGYCDTLIYSAHFNQDNQNRSHISAFNITNNGPIKLDSIVVDRLYSFNQSGPLVDISDNSQHVVMFDRTNGSNLSFPDEEVSAYLFSLSSEDKIVRSELIYGSGLDIILSANKSHILNIVDTNGDGVNEAIIGHSLSEQESFILNYAQPYMIRDKNFRTYVIASLNNGVLTPLYVSQLLAQNQAHLSINSNSDIVVGNGLYPQIYSKNKQIKTPQNLSDYQGNVYLDDDGSRYQATESGLTKFDKNGVTLWTIPSLPRNGFSKFEAVRLLGRYQNIAVVNYGYASDIYFIDDTNGELLLDSFDIMDFSISPDFNSTGLIYIEAKDVVGATGSIRGSGVYRAKDEVGVELVRNWSFSNKYRIRRQDVSWLNLDDDQDYELIFRLERRESNEVFTTDYNGDNQRVTKIEDRFNPTHDISRSAAWDIDRRGYFYYRFYFDKLSNEIIWELPVNSSYSDTRYENNLKQLAISDRSLYLFESN